MNDRTRWIPIAATLALAATTVDAQTAAHTGLIVAPNGQCLTLEGNFTAAHPPPTGTRVVLDRCDGRPTQRWTVVVGDYNLTRGLGELCLDLARTDAGAVALVGLTCQDEHSGVTLSSHSLTLTSYSEHRCIAAQTTSAGTTLSLETCHESPAQHWEER